MQSFSYPVNRSVLNKTEDYGLLTQNYKDVTGNIETLARDIKSGYAIASGLTNGKTRCDASFSGTNLLIVEFDNAKIKTNAEGIPLAEDGSVWSKGKKKAKEYVPNFTIEDALADTFTSSYAALIYTSPSHTEDWNRFRVVFITPYQINDAELARSATLFLMERYGNSDPSCKDLCRAWFGNTSAQFPIYQDVSLPESFLEDVLEYNTNRIEALENAKKRREAAKRLLDRASSEDCIDVKALARQALNYCPPREPGTNTYSSSLAILTAIKSLFGDSEGQALAESWSPSTKEWHIEHKWHGLKDDFSPGIIFKAARAQGWSFPKHAENLRSALNRISAAEKEPDVDKAVEILETENPLPDNPITKAPIEEKPDFNKTIDEFDEYISEYTTDLERGWEADNFAFDKKLTQRRITGNKLLTLSQARKDGNGELVVSDALDILDRNREGRKWIIAGNVPLGTTIVLAASGGSGKAQPLDAKVLTPSGWRLMGEIKEGDRVIGRDGKPTRVLGVFPQGEKKIYEVTFSDGSKTQCCDDHLWFTKSKSERDRHREGSVKSLKEIRETLKTGTRGDRNHSVPMVDSVEFDSQPVPLDPFLVGALIGDGGLTRKSILISKEDPEFIRNVTEAMPNGVQLNHSDRCTWRFAKIGDKNPWVKNPVTVALDELNLLGLHSFQKFVPDCYKFNSIDVRVAILQGLLDSDGEIYGENSIAFSTTSEQLAFDVQFLVQSLGGKAVKTSRQTYYTYKGIKKAGRPSWRLHISLPSSITPSRSLDKLGKYKPKTKYPPMRLIIDVQEAGIKPCQCIKVDSEESLYVTDDFIVTHNTTMLYNFSKCIATGEPWSGFRVQKGKVLVIQTDEPECDVAEKLDIAEFHNIPRGSVDFILDWRFTQIRQLKDLITANNYSLIIIDSWTAAHSGTGTDLISSTAGDNMYKLRNIAQECNCTFIVVHHFNKNNDLRDSSTINDNASEIWKLNNWDEKDKIPRDQRILEISKSRAGLSGKYVFQQSAMDYSWQHLGKYEDREKPGDPAMPQILQVLESSGGDRLSISRLNEKLPHLDMSTVADTVESLRRIGMCDSEQVIRTHPNGEVSRYRLYFLPSEEQTANKKQGRHLYAI